MSERWTWHGGGLQAAKAHFGEGDRPWLDLSTGINPQPWPGADTIAVDWHRLPEPEALAGLEAAAAKHFGAPVSHVCAVPGSEIGLRLLGRLIAGPAATVVPTYRTHAEMFARPSLVARTDFALAEGNTLVLANPNNPDGHATGRETLLALADARGDGWLVVDEAFADCTPELSVAGDVQDGRRLVVSRSFGKFFGLAGVRLGFVIAPPALLARVRALIGAWPVSAAAIAIGTAAYADDSWIDATRYALAERSRALDALLDTAGYTAIGACPLFRLVETSDPRALFERLARRAILTRPFAENPSWLRIGLPADTAAMDRLDAALRDG